MRESQASLPFEPPLELGALFAFFARRAIAGIEEVVDGVYRRSLALPHGAAVVELAAAGEGVRARLWLDDARDRASALARCRALLDLDADPAAVAAALGDDPLIGRLVRAAPGLRVPGAASGHEIAVRAVLGQQVSLAGAATLAGRLVAAHGVLLNRPVGAVTHVFPTSGALAGIDDPAALAMPQARRRALLGLAAALDAGDIVLDDPGADRAEVVRRLLGLPGIGPWTASYIAMRALGDRDAFLPTDLGVRHATAALGADPAPRAVTRLAERWRPYRAYAVQHLWASLAAT